MAIWENWLPRDPQDGLDLGVDLSGFGDQPAVGQGQLGLGLLQDQLIAPLGGALVLRVTPDGVLLPGVLKHQLHFRGHLRRGVFGAKHSGVRLSPLAWPKRAKVMASKIVVLPAPVSPVMR